MRLMEPTPLSAPSNIYDFDFSMKHDVPIEPRYSRRSSMANGNVELTSLLTSMLDLPVINDSNPFEPTPINELEGMCLPFEAIDTTPSCVTPSSNKGNDFDELAALNCESSFSWFKQEERHSKLPNVAAAFAA